ncbi:MAG: hypothetical protein BYD32DRAFT_460397 [Podila humilis]|nr:MAG: hypothetical protein BYD32DRAFT_460397 [Podila humilis]
MGQPCTDSQLHSQRSSNNSSTPRYYVYAGATFPFNGDESPIDRNNYVSFPGKTGSCHLKIGDSGYAPSPSLSLPSPLSSRFAHSQDRGWVGGEHHSSLRSSLILDELLDPYQSNVDISELVSANIKRTTSSTSLGEYQDYRRAPVLALRSAFGKNIQHETKSSRNSNAEIGIVYDSLASTAAYAPTSTRPLHPRHQTKERIDVIQGPRSVSARQTTSESVALTRPAPPIRRRSFRKSPCQQSPIYLNESAVTQSDNHLDRRLHQRPQGQNQPPKKMLAPRARPSVFGAFSSLPPNMVSAPMTVHGDSVHRHGEDILDRRVSETIWRSSTSSVACTGTIASCISDLSQANESVSPAPLYVWTPTPELRTSSIMGNHTFSSSSPCLTTAVASASAPAASLLLRAKKPGRRFSLHWFSKKRPLDSSTLTPSISPSLGVPDRTIGLGCTCTDHGHCRLHKDLAGIPNVSGAPGQEDIVRESKHRFLRLGHKRHDRESKARSNRLSVMSTTSLRTLVRGSNEDKGKSASATWVSKLKLKRGSMSDPSTTASTITSDAATTSAHRGSLLGAIRERRSGPFQIDPKTVTMSASILVPEIQKPPRWLIPNVVQRALDRHAGHADRSSNSLMFEWDGHSNARSTHSTPHSTVAAPAASAMPKLGIPNYTPVMSASSPCLLSMSPEVPRRAQGTCNVSEIMPAPISTPGPSRDWRYQSMNEERDSSRPATTLVPKQVATSYEKRKMSFFEPFRIKNRDPSYISFHFDISHLEDQRLDQGATRTSECQDENQESENQCLATHGDQTSTKLSEHCDQDAVEDRGGPVVEGAQDSPSPHSLFHIFRRPVFLSSMPSLSLPSLLFPDFSSSKRDPGRVTNPRPQAALSSVTLSNPVPASRDPLDTRENYAANLSRWQPHHFCHEGLQSTDRDPEGGASIVQNAADKNASVFGELVSNYHSPDAYSKELPLLPPLRQFSRGRKVTTDNRFSVSSVSLQLC